MRYYNISAKDGSWAQTIDPERVGRVFLGLGLGPLEIVLSDQPNWRCVVAYDLSQVRTAIELLNPSRRVA